MEATDCQQEYNTLKEGLRHESVYFFESYPFDVFGPRQAAKEVQLLYKQTGCSRTSVSVTQQQVSASIEFRVDGLQTHELFWAALSD